MSLFNFETTLKKIANSFFSKVAKGTLVVIFPDNEKIFYKGKDKGYLAEIKLLNYKVFFKIINRGPVGFAESYMDGDFTSKNLSNLFIKF